MKIKKFLLILSHLLVYKLQILTFENSTKIYTEEKRPITDIKPNTFGYPT